MQTISVNRLLRPALSVFLLLTLITGIVYPFLVTGIANLAFPTQAAGSLLTKDGRTIGSSLIGQNFSDPKFFWGRMSATAPAYNAAASVGSNFGPLNPALLDAANARIEALRAADPANTDMVPVDLVTASGSGLDPHISVAAASYQLARVAGARGLDPATVEMLLAQHTEQRQWALFGEARVNVLLLNLALEQLQNAN